jgi:hydrogenase maturation protease
MTSKKATMLHNENTHNKLILFAIGNSGRGDDGLGWAFARRLEEQGFDGEILYRYQLQIEDADRIKDAEIVVFVDAWMEPEPKESVLRECYPSAHASYSTHRLEPSAVLHLCRELYGKAPIAFELLIPGERWDLGKKISPKGLFFLKEALKKWEYGLAFTL